MPKKYSNSALNDLKEKALNWPPKIVQFCDDPENIYTISSHPKKKRIILLKAPQKIEIKILNPQKWSEPAYNIWKF